MCIGCGGLYEASRVHQNERYRGGKWLDQRWEEEAKQKKEEADKEEEVEEEKEVEEKEEKEEER